MYKNQINFLGKKVHLIRHHCTRNTLHELHQRLIQIEICDFTESQKPQNPNIETTVATKSTFSQKEKVSKSKTTLQRRDPGLVLPFLCLGQRRNQ